VQTESASRKRWTTIGLIAAAVTLTGCSEKGVVRINGGGSTFVDPLMKKWKKAYNDAKHAEVDYAPKGSGNGIQQMIAGTYHFGCTDAPMNKEELENARKNRGEVLHIPLVFGAVVPIYNLPELKDAKEPLHFSGPVLADIFLGNIKKWNDPSLAALNPGVALPDKGIVVVHRADPSGTTFIFTEYLSKVSPQWLEKVGPGAKDLGAKWQTGSGQPGNKGVAGHVSTTEGALGYVELDYAQENKLAAGSMQNKDGKVVMANTESIVAAATAAAQNPPDDLCLSMIDQGGEKAYPICGTVWAVLYVNQPKEGPGNHLTEFMTWCVHDGQKLTAGTSYAPLPDSLVQKIDEKLKLVKVGTGVQ